MLTPTELALVRGLDDVRQRPVGERVEVARVAGPRLVGQEPPPGGRKAVALEDLLGHDLVHGERAREDAGAGARQLEARAQALHRAVFAPRPVEGVPHDRGAGRFEPVREALAGLPVDGDHIPAALLEGGEHARAGIERDLTLGG